MRPLISRLFAALDVDVDQWLALTKTALRTDLRASAFMRAQFGSQVRAAGALISQALFYTIMGGFVAVFVWVSGDLFLSGVAVLTYVMFMVGTAALLDHNAAIISPDDHAILGFRPVTSRTYFAARLANVLVYTTVMTTLFAYLPVASFFIRWGFAVGLAAVAAVYAASAAVALTMVVVYASLLRLIGPSRIKRVLSYVQFVFSFFVYGGYFFLSRVATKGALAGFALKKTIWILLLPPTWFASYLDIAAGRASVLELAPAAASVVLVVVLARALGGRLSLDYAERLSAIAAATARPLAPSKPARSTRAWWFRAGEARAVALLIRSQFANDMKFRMGVLAILPLTIIYLLMGLSDEGTLGDPFMLDQSGQALRMVTIAMLMFPTILKLNLGRSDAYRASWIFFACPVDRAAMVRAAKNVLVVVFLLPYTLIVGAVLAYLSTNVWHLAVHLTVVGLMSHLALQVVTLMDPELPFSKPMQKGRSSTRVFMVMMVVGVGAVLLPLLGPLMYRTTTGITIVFGTLIGASLLLDRMTRLRIEAQAARLEFEG